MDTGPGNAFFPKFILVFFYVDSCCQKGLRCDAMRGLVPEVATAARAQPAAPRPAQHTALADGEAVNVKEMYTQLAALGLNYGPKFQVTESARACNYYSS